jgi:hypothetical protein
VVERVPGEATEFAVACLCAPDDKQSEAAAALKRAGVRLVWLVGDHQVDGADGVLAPGGDALEALRRTLELLEVP